MRFAALPSRGCSQAPFPQLGNHCCLKLHFYSLKVLYWCLLNALFPVYVCRISLWIELHTPSCLDLTNVEKITNCTSSSDTRTPKLESMKRNMPRNQTLTWEHTTQTRKHTCTHSVRAHACMHARTHARTDLTLPVFDLSVFPQCWTLTTHLRFWWIRLWWTEEACCLIWPPLSTPLLRLKTLKTINLKIGTRGQRSRTPLQPNLMIGEYTWLVTMEMVVNQYFLCRSITATSEGTLTRLWTDFFFFFRHLFFKWSKLEFIKWLLAAP